MKQVAVKKAAISALATANVIATQPDALPVQEFLQIKPKCATIKSREILPKILNAISTSFAEFTTA